MTLLYLVYLIIPYYITTNEDNDTAPMAKTYLEV